LRCKNNEERKAKLSAKGLANVDIKPRLNEYNDTLIMEDETVNFEPNEKTDQKMETRPNDQVSATTSQETSALGETKNNLTDKGNQLVHEHSEETRTSLLLKDSQAQYEVNRNHKTSLSQIDDEDCVHSGASSMSSTALSKNQKQDLENLSRAFARRELENQGYAVEEMPQENPGFDLRAIKDSNELRVELKAHLSKGSVIELTARQYKEYLDQEQGGYEWQLWNVEYLEKSQMTIRITPYSSIPEDALDSKTFRVDLKRCSL
jgi:hypothetical protein